MNEQYLYRLPFIKDYSGALLEAIVLAAGEGTRLRPFTLSQPKVMIPIANKPILEYVIESLSQCDISDITLVIGYKKEKVMNYFESGKKFGVNLTYIEQPQQLGTAHAIKLAEDSISNNFLVLNGDNLISAQTIKDAIDDMSGDVTLLLTIKENVKGYGVVTTEGNKVTQVIEKPGTDVSHFVNTGVYVFSPMVFDEIPYTKISLRGEYEITDTIQRMIDKRYEVKGVHTTSTWIDASYPWDLLNANAAVLGTLGREKPIKRKGIVEEGATIKGKVVLGENSVIRAGSYLVGPIVVGKDAEIGPNVTILPCTSIGNGVVISSCTEVRNSIIMSDVRVGTNSFIANSIVGKNTLLGSHFITEQDSLTSVNLDGEFQHVMNIGAIIGENCRFGHNVLVESGKIIGIHCNVESGAIIRKNVINYSTVL